MSGKQRRLSRHDDRPGSAPTLWHLWQAVPATEEVDGGRLRVRSDCIPDLGSPLGPVEPDEGADPAA